MLRSEIWLLMCHFYSEILDEPPNALFPVVLPGLVVCVLTLLLYVGLGEFP